MEGSTQDIGQRAAFIGRAGEFFSLALVGNLLLIPTFGFYRFWLITDARRHLWSHTHIGDEAFEYTGRGRELLIGFLIALAILTPLYIAYFILGVEAELFQAFASLPLALIFYVLAHYGSYRARRYRASRTNFRGVRLWMDGSGWRYAGTAITWDIATVLSLGLALPWRNAALEAYKMQHTYFGDLPAEFTGTGGGLFKRGWWLWLFSIIPLFLIFPAFAGRGDISDPHYDGLMSFLIFMAWLMVMIVVYPLYRAVEMRWWLDGIRFGEIALVSELGMISVLWCYIKAILASIAYVMLAGGIFAAIWMNVTGFFDFYIEDFDPTLVPPDIILPMIFFYGLVLAGFGVIVLHFVTRGVWRVATNSVTVFNLAALDAVVARGAASDLSAEGLADALDFGAGAV